MEQNLNNPINSTDNNNTNLNLKQQYNELKKKIENLEKNNHEMLEMYKAEEQRLIKSNEFLMQKSNHNNSRNIQDLEAEVLKMRNNIKQIQNMMEPRNGINLIENDNLSSNSNSNNKLNASNEEKIKEEYLINYKNKLKTEFEKKLIMKHQELIDFYTEQNKKIIENNLDPENIIDINEIKFFSIKNNNKEKNNPNEQSSFSEENDLDIEKINLVLSIFCIKEEFPKEFFIDYILDEAYTERGKNKSIENKREIGRRPSAIIIPHEIDVVNNNKISEKICQLFDIKDKGDIDLIKSYINEILKFDKNLRNYFEKNLNKYRFAPFEAYEIEKYDKKIKECFGKYKDEIQDLLNLDENIITLKDFEVFLNKSLKDEDREDEFLFYVMNLMKLSKSERKNEKVKRLKSLKFYEFNLNPFYQKIIN